MLFELVFINNLSDFKRDFVIFFVFIAVGFFLKDLKTLGDINVLSGL